MKNWIGLAVLASLAVRVAAQDPTRVIAVVNGQEIKGAEFYRRMEYLTGVGKIIGGTFVERTPGFWALEAIINERIILAVAAEKKVTPTDAEVQQELRYRLESDPKLLDNWLASGQTRPELEHAIKVQLAQFKIATAGVIVTDQEVNKFYADNPFSFTIPKLVKLRVIAVTDPAKKAQVDLQLQQGIKFEEVAKALSEDITAKSGGDFGNVPLNSLHEQFRNALNAIKVGQYTGWLESGGNSMRFFLEAVTPERLQPLDEPMKRSIRRRLMLDRGRVRNDIGKEMAAMRAKMKVDVKVGYLAEEWQEFVRRLNTIGG